MKKFVFILSLFLAVNCAFASQYTSQLDKLENSVFGFTYSDDDTSRLTRLEQTIYGEGKSGDISKRISALNKDMSADLIGQEIEPVEDTFADKDMYVPEEQFARDYVAPAAANVDYPSINELEKSVFKKEFKSKNIDDRLSALEKETFGQSYVNDAFFDRVDRLQAKIKPKSFMENALAQSSNSYFDGDIIPLDKDYNLEEYGSPSFDYDEYNARHQAPSRVNLASVERSMFKKSFTKEEIDTRLTRLENTMFGTTFEDDTQQNRINRIASAYKAQKTANKYDSNKFTQNMAAATQIGMLILMILACVL